jgi:hypothetical protein
VCFGMTNGIANLADKCTSRQSSAQRGNQPPRACAHRRNFLKIPKIANLGFLWRRLVRALVGVIWCIARTHGVFRDDKRHRQPCAHKPPIQRAAWQSALIVFLVVLNLGERNESVRTQATNSKIPKIANLGFLCWGMIRALVGVIRCIAWPHCVLRDDKRDRQPCGQMHKPPIQRAAWQSAAESGRTPPTNSEMSKNRESRVFVAGDDPGPCGCHPVLSETTRCASG